MLTLLLIAGRACHFISHVVFLIMLILMAKGWTVTRQEENYIVCRSQNEQNVQKPS